MVGVRLHLLSLLSILLAVSMLACSPALNTSSSDTGKIQPTQESSELTLEKEVQPICSDYLGLAADYNAERKGISMVVMVDNKIIFEDYPNDGSSTRFQALASGTKSFCGAMAVAAAADGFLSLDERVSSTIPEWENDPRKSNITIRQLLSLTSGLKTGDELRKVPTYVQAIEVEAVHDPGTTFTYGPVPFQVFGEVMRRKLISREQTPLEYIKHRIFEPIGLDIGYWRHGLDGNPQMPSGASLTAQNWAKYGELIRLSGKWNGDQILPAKLLEECFSGTSANPAYGLTWWLNREVATDLRRAIPQLTLATTDLTDIPGIPRDLVFAAGAGKQRLYISRKIKLVVVRQASGIIETISGRSRNNFSDAEFLSLLLTGKSALTHNN